MQCRSEGCASVTLFVPSTEEPDGFLRPPARRRPCYLIPTTNIREFLQLGHVRHHFLYLQFSMLNRMRPSPQRDATV
ncbi:unnamed protein product [Nesidiocoris tenuis]|uniref:Uncharacterized protein n=1 Tax=Nesidiocoris tenuis TaxID=355587 RepID=A0A6H5G5C8_9HEMI|nr:unnamed protein product [Nesidiocoris tenuis]